MFGVLTSMPYGTRNGLAKYPKKLRQGAIRALINRALFKESLRPSLLTKGQLHNSQAVHGFRKFFKTTYEQVMKPANVEILMGHDSGISQSYYKPTDSQLFEVYLNAVGLLTINEENRLSKQIIELEGINKDNEHLMNRKISEKR